MTFGGESSEERGYFFSRYEGPREDMDAALAIVPDGTGIAAGDPVDLLLL